MFKKWVAYNALGELSGLAIASILSVLAFQTLMDADFPFHLVLVVLVVFLAGIAEGGLLGFFQAKAMKDFFPDINASQWAFRTAVAGGLCWILGSSPFFIFSQMDFVSENQEGPGMGIVILMSIMGGLFLGGMIGLFQSGLLASFGVKRWKWIAANAAGWLIGIAVIFVFASVPNEDTPLYLVIPLALVAGALAGAIIGLVTGVMSLKKYFYPDRLYE